MSSADSEQCAGKGNIPKKKEVETQSIQMETSKKEKVPTSNCKNAQS